MTNKVKLILPFGKDIVKYEEHGVSVFRSGISNGSFVMRGNILPAAFVWAILNFWHDSQRWT